MIPEILVDDSGNPLLLTMNAMVGSGAPNNRADVALVQSLLVSYQSARGLASTRPIDVDGIVGPQTIQAITTYQKHNSLTADGLVGPRGETIHSLIQTLQAMRAPITPMPGLAAATSEVLAPFSGAKALSPWLKGAVGSSRNLIGGVLGAPFTPTSWIISQGTTVDVGWKDKGVYLAHLDIKNDDDGSTVHVVIRAYVVMASKGSPLAFDISLPSDPSQGGRIWRGLSGVAFNKASLFGPCAVSMAGFEAGVGFGLTLFQFGWALAPPGMCNGFAVTAGYQKGIPSIGVASGGGAATPF
jgi:Putative peptidoglycan binding domain